MTHIQGYITTEYSIIKDTHVLIVFYRFIGLVWDVLIFQARALAVQAVVVTVVVSAAPEVQTVRDVRACYV